MAMPSGMKLPEMPTMNSLTMDSLLPKLPDMPSGDTKEECKQQ
jgi:hypothetical protein